MAFERAGDVTGGGRVMGDDAGIAADSELQSQEEFCQWSSGSDGLGDGLMFGRRP